MAQPNLSFRGSCGSCCVGNALQTRGIWLLPSITIASALVGTCWCRVVCSAQHSYNSGQHDEPISTQPGRASRSTATRPLPRLWLPLDRPSAQRAVPRVWIGLQREHDRPVRLGIRAAGNPDQRKMDRQEHDLVSCPGNHPSAFCSGHALDHTSSPHHHDDTVAGAGDCSAADAVSAVACGDQWWEPGPRSLPTIPARSGGYSTGSGSSVTRWLRTAGWSGPGQDQALAATQGES